MNFWILVILIEILYQIKYTHAAYTKLYYTHMDNGLGWQFKGIPYSSDDPQYCAVGNCVYLTGTSSITQSGIGTFRFNSIKLQYSIAPYQLAVNDKCRVSYSIDDINYQTLQVYDKTSPIITHLTELKRDADNLAAGHGISIKFESISGGNNPNEFRCYFDEIYVFGVYGTRQPSKYPTVNPTPATPAPSTNPTLTPSNHPSISPTRYVPKHPTASPVKLWGDFKNVQTSNPTRNPTISPVSSVHVHVTPQPTIDTTASGMCII